MRRIGVPRAQGFHPDPFQLEALDLIEENDVLVSAPTGAGKTWIAVQAIHSSLSKGKRTWYASPLKALSNSIYLEFCREFGKDSCGIITGDRKLNPEAPVIVGTTEILRNQLYDAMHEGADIRADLVILDEAHYLSDPDRGVVWEEVLIYLPGRIRLLLLSATIPNAEEVCSWLREIRGTSNRIVSAEGRPVPLEMLFFLPDGNVVPLGAKRGLHPRIRKFLRSSGPSSNRVLGKMDFGVVLALLRKLDLLPAIFFLKSRADCDRALRMCPPVEGNDDIKVGLRKKVNAFLRDFPHLQGHRQMRFLLDSLVGSHHGGQLPYWKLLVERLMSEGYLEAIFSTSTVAAGVNFPARTVVLVQSDRFNGREFIDLTATELHQMIGRAGRRGKDRIGFVAVLPGLHQDPELLQGLRNAPPDPIRSQIRITFSMVLNLLLSHRPMEIKDLLEKSFAAYQEGESNPQVREKWDRTLSELQRLIPNARCDSTDPHEILGFIQQRAEVRKERRRLEKRMRYERKAQVYKNYLGPGRLFLHKDRNLYVAFETTEKEGRLICLAHNLKRRIRAGKSGLRLKRVALEQIKAIYDFQVDLPTIDLSPKRLAEVFSSIPTRGLAQMDIAVAPEGWAGAESLGSEQREPSPCRECEHEKLCHSSRQADLRRLLDALGSLSFELEAVGGGLWPSFKRHLRFLKETGFVDAHDRLTPEGLWASKLRLDQPLLIAEAIRNHALEGLSPELLAAAIAPFVWDKVQEVELRVGEGQELGEVARLYDKILHRIRKMMMLKRRRGFWNPPSVFWPAAALFFWAKGVLWEDLLSMVPVDEGDLASLIMRTADHLRQVTNLAGTHPELASRAREAIGLILREPVYIP